MPLLEGEDFDDGGKNKQFWFFDFLLFLKYMHSWPFNFINADVGPKHHVGMSLITRHVARQFDVTPYQEGSDNEEDILWNLEGLTHGILEYAQVRDIPC